MFGVKESVITVELLFIRKKVVSNESFHLFNGFFDMVRTAFPDSKIASQFSVSRFKPMYTIQRRDEEKGLRKQLSLNDITNSITEQMNKLKMKQNANATNDHRKLIILIFNVLQVVSQNIAEEAEQQKINNALIARRNAKSN